jgi:hypothetical protein
MPVSTVQRVVFEKALAITGSVSHLALILNVNVTDVESWRTGDELCPTSVFNAVAELVQAAGGFPEATKKPEPGQPHR